MDINFVGMNATQQIRSKFEELKYNLSDDMSWEYRAGFGDCYYELIQEIEKMFDSDSPIVANVPYLDEQVEDITQSEIAEIFG